MQSFLNGKLKDLREKFSNVVYEKEKSALFPVNADLMAKAKRAINDDVFKNLTGKKIVVAKLLETCQNLNKTRLRIMDARLSP